MTALSQKDCCFRIISIGEGKAPWTVKGSHRK